ncbi:hypothetical protein HY933_04435 [Candidatus Falkowbacteria bacterium]|nr:hypothetical protein [Candidatus Falkowbacteria bacterium]
MGDVLFDNMGLWLVVAPGLTLTILFLLGVWWLLTHAAQKGWAVAKVAMVLFMVPWLKPCCGD